MTLSLSRLAWRWQLVVLGGVSLAGVGAYWHVRAAPARIHIAERRAAVSLTRAAAARGRSTAAGLPAVRADVSSLERRLDGIEALGLANPDVGELFREVETMATEANVVIRGLTPATAAARPLYAEHPHSLHLEGTFHQLGAFFEEIGRAERLLTVTELHITQHGRQSADTTILADCVLTTFTRADPAIDSAGSGVRR